MAKATRKRRKHVPQRTCVGCRTVQEKRTLIRVVRSPQGVRVDAEGKAPGRGAYLHNSRACWKMALDGRLAYALKAEITAEERQALIGFMESLPEED